MEKRKQKNKMKKKKLRDKKNDCESNYKWLSNWGWWHAKKTKDWSFYLTDYFTLRMQYFYNVQAVLDICLLLFSILFFFFFCWTYYYLLWMYCAVSQVFTSEIHRSLTKPTSSNNIWNQFFKPRSWMNKGQIMCLFL